jgi:hypothetical protein
VAKFQKGQSGNPGGRPKVLGDIRELAREHCPAAFRELIRLTQEAEAETTKLAAIKELLDRGYGKATQPLAGIGDDGELTSTIRVLYAQASHPED